MLHTPSSPVFLSLSASSRRPLLFLRQITYLFIVKVRNYSVLDIHSQSILAYLAHTSTVFFMYHLLVTGNSTFSCNPRFWDAQQRYATRYVVDMLIKPFTHFYRSYPVLPLNSNYFFYFSLVALTVQTLWRLAARRIFLFAAASIPPL